MLLLRKHCDFPTLLATKFTTVKPFSHTRQISSVKEIKPKIYSKPDTKSVPVRNLAPESPDFATNSSAPAAKRTARTAVHTAEVPRSSSGAENK